MFFYIFKCLVNVCNVSIRNMGYKVGFLGWEGHPYALYLEVAFQGQNSIHIGHSVYLTL